ncbi:hypothetical protein M426DRAFT_19458 [Hypoxylon sp. CI-4A]|nr:hypothetical protein M426DRAFT_19458 [Hypoxylon sp. CI-4A]
MVVKLEPHQTSLEPFGLPWSPYHVHHPDDDPGDGSRSRYFRISASAPTSPPSVFQVLKAGGSGNGSNGGGNGGGSGHSHGGRRLAGPRPRLAKIQIELQPCQPQLSRSPSPSPTDAADSRPKPKKANSAPVVLQTQSNIGGEGREERSSNAPRLSRTDARSQIRPLTASTPSSNPPRQVEKRKPPTVFSFPRETFAPPTVLALRPAKRVRALHDVDGPGTGSLSCKKRRLRLQLVTSRLSQPYSWPATHILNRESGDDAPMLSQFLKFAAVSALKRAGHQSSLVRKAAILNRVRIGVRQAAVLRGHTVIAGMAARGNHLSHGLQVITSSNREVNAIFPALGPNPYDQPVPPAWRPHTTAFHPPFPGWSPPDPGASTRSSSAAGTAASNLSAAVPRKSPSPRPSTPAGTTNTSPGLEDENEDVAFPSPDLESRYVDLSDDDMDDVYADFGVLFGSGARSPEGGGGESAGGEHFYEEYLDELDGIRWVA